MLRTTALARRIPQRPACWKTHLIRTLAFAADRSWTATAPVTNPSSYGELIKRAAKNKRAFLHTQVVNRSKSSRHLTYSSHMVFNLASSLELSHLVQAVKLRQCERAWSIYRTLRKSSRNPVIPTEVVGELYALLRYARTLTVTDKLALEKDQQVESILNDIELSGISKEEFVQTVNDIPIMDYKLLHHAIRSEQPDKAIEIFHRLKASGESKKLTKRWIYSMLDMLASQDEKAFHEIIEYLSQHEVTNISDSDLQLLANIYSLFKSKKNAVAQDQIHQLTTEWYSAENLEDLVWIAHRFKQFDLLEYMMDTAKASGVVPTCDSYVMLMRSHRHTNQHTSALEAFQEMMSNDITPSVAAFNTLLQILSDQRATDKISVLIQAMIDRGYQPDIASFSEAIKANSKAGNLHACIEYYHMMQDLGIQPNLYSYNILINAFSVANNISEVVHWFQTMLADGILPNHVTITTLIKTFATEDSAADSAIRIFEQGKATGIKPDVILYTSLIKIFAHSANMQAALAIHGDMLADGIDPNVYTYTSLIEACVNTSQMDVAQKIFDLMKETENKKPNAFTYCVMLQAWIKTQDLDKIKEMYQETMELVRSGIIQEDPILAHCLLQSKMCLEREAEMASQLP